MDYVSLLPPEIKQRRIDEQRQGKLIRIAVVVMVILLIVYAYLMVSTFLTRSTLQSLRDQREDLESQAAALQEYGELYNEMTDAEDRLNRAMGNVPDWDQFLKELGMALNPEASITELSIAYHDNNNNDDNETDEQTTGGNGSFDMRGWSYSHGNVADILERVQELDQLDNVRFRVSSEATVNNRAAVQFTVDAILLPGPVFFDPDEGGS